MEYYMVVGTYTRENSKGIYVFSFDSETGKFSEISTEGSVLNPSYVAIAGNHVYAVSEEGGDNATVSAFSFDKSSGTLTLLNSQHTGGDHPCYVEVDATGKFVAVANYSGGSICLFKVDEDGSLGSDKQFIQHHGGSVDQDRQQGPHAHMATFSPDQKYLLVPDLGKDRVIIYKFDQSSKSPLSFHSEIVCEPGSGPRHLAFHPDKPLLYLITEMKPMVGVYEFKNGIATPLQEVQAWQKGFEGDKDGAAIKVSSDGRFVYASNRGDQNVIGIYEVDQNTGKLTRKGFQPSKGKGPRDFAFDPSGRFLIVANQESSNLVTFRIDGASGGLTEVGQTSLPSPVCVKFTTK